MTAALEIAAGSDSFVTGMTTFCFNESSEYCQFGESEVQCANLCTIEFYLRADYVAYS